MSPAPAKEVIYLDVDDDITSIIDKVENAGSKVVALVLPKRATALQSIVNMRLLARSAENASKNAVLITTETALLPLAGAAGLRVAKNLQSAPELPSSPVPPAPTKHAAETVPVPEDGTEAEDDLPKKIDYNRSIGELAAKDEADRPETIELDGDEVSEAASTLDAPQKAPAAPKDKRLAVPNFDRFRLMLGLGIAGVVALIVFIILAIWILPKATIAVTTTSVPVSTNFTLTTSDSAKTLDEKAGTIPASLKTSDQTTNQQIQATGQQNNGTKATGTVTLTATECAPNIGQPDSIPAGSGVTSGGLTYITQATTSFGGPSGGSGSCVTYNSTASTKIIASAGGTKYNTSNSATFAVNSRSDVSGSGSASGGTDNIVTVVSQADVDNASKKLTSSDSDTFTKAFEKQLSDAGLYAIGSTLKLSDPVTSASPGVGQPASTATVNIKITYSILTVKKSDLQKAITDKLTSQIGSTQKLSNSDNVLAGASVTVANQTSPVVAQLAVGEDTTAVPQLDIASIKKQSAGQKSADIRSAIGGINGVKNVDVRLSPFWVSKVPKNTAKIQVIQQQVKS